MSLGGLRWLLVVWLCCLGGGAWADVGQPEQCVPRVLNVMAARADVGDLVDASARPAAGWVPVTLPDTWTLRWPGRGGAVWYRIDWDRGCGTGAAEAAALSPVALGIDGMSMAGEVYSNADLMWRDASLVELLSHSWNMPRWWLLPASSLHEGVNTVWVRVAGLAELSPGLGHVRLGSPAAVEAEHASRLWRQRTAYVITAGLSTAMGCLFLVVWAMRRAEHAYGWYALMSLCWVLYLYTLLATSPWPFTATLALSRVNIAAFVLYTWCFCLFTWRFGGQVLPRLEQWLRWLVVLGVAAVLLAPQSTVVPVFTGVWIGFVLVFFANCVQFQWHAWRTREPQHLLLALCWLLFLVVGVHDLVVVLAQWHGHTTWSAVTGLLATVCMALLVGGRMAAGMRRIERFNHELSDGVEAARAELAQALQREHAQAVQHAKLQERMQISHDLHDGLGGSLVRSMALVEQAREPLPNERVLSLMKVMRDDLRQVIDHGSSAGAVVPATPVQWAAPLRHRFTRILDELGVVSHWQIAAQWQGVPSALQCLGLTRLAEEALSNVIKHSQARHLRVTCAQPRPAVLEVRIEDDGVGFDVAAVQRAGLSVGMRSMVARAARIGGTCQVQSGPSGTLVLVTLVL